MLFTFQFIRSVLLKIMRTSLKTVKHVVKHKICRFCVFSAVMRENDTVTAVHVWASDFLCVFQGRPLKLPSLTVRRSQRMQLVRRSCRGSEVKPINCCVLALSFDTATSDLSSPKKKRRYLEITEQIHLLWQSKISLVPQQSHWYTVDEKWGLCGSHL